MLTIAKDINSELYEDPHGTKVLFLYSAGYLIYQVLGTAPQFKSPHFKLYEFTAANGVRIGSKNSPLFVSPTAIFLQGAFREFDLKPSIYFVKDYEGFLEVVDPITDALMELSKAYSQPDFQPRVIEVRDGVADQ